MEPAHHDPSPSTSPTLLERVRRQEPEAWRRFAELYGPLVYRWSLRHGVAAADAADVMQDVFQAVFQSLDRFERESAGDSLRGWLWGVTKHKVCDHFRRRQGEPAAPGGTTAHERLQAVAAAADEPPESAAAVETEITHRALEMLRAEFEISTWQAFLATAIDGRPAADVAGDLGLTVTAVYKAKSRVLLRLRHELSGLVG